MSDVVIFADNPTPVGVMRSVAPYRLRTSLEQAGYTCTVIDMLSYCIDSNNWQAIVDAYIDQNTIVGLSTTFFQTPLDADDILSGRIEISSKPTIPASNTDDWFRFLHYIHEKGAKIVFGGSRIVNFMTEQYRGVVDFFVSGYADGEIIDLVRYIKGKNPFMQFENTNGFRVIKSTNKFSIDNIRTIFKPSDYIKRGEVLPIEVSRGCRFKCKFCYYPLNGRKKNDYVRSSEDLYNDFLYNFNTFGTTMYRFLDDTFNESIEKLEMLADVAERLPFTLKFEAYIRHELLDDEQLFLLRRCGLKSAILGIETLNKTSGSAIGKGMEPEKTLTIVRKLRKAIPDCYISTGIIIGLPDDSMKNIQWAYKLAERSDLFDKIAWYPLAMRVKSPFFQLSELEESPEQYGYTQSDDQTFANQLYVNWKNKHGMTFIDACKIVYDLETRSIKAKTFKPVTRYAFSIINVGADLEFIESADSFKQLGTLIIDGMREYKQTYVEQLLKNA